MEGVGVMALLWLLPIPVILFCVASIISLTGNWTDYFDQWWAFPSHLTMSACAVGGGLYLALLCFEMSGAG